MASISMMTTPWMALDMVIMAVTMASSTGYVASTASSNKTGYELAIGGFQNLKNEFGWNILG